MIQLRRLDDVLSYQSSHNQIVKTIIGFANQFGGRLIVGIADRGSIVGIPVEIVDELTETLFDLKINLFLLSKFLKG